MCVSVEVLVEMSVEILMWTEILEVLEVPHWHGILHLYVVSHCDAVKNWRMLNSKKSKAALDLKELREVLVEA